VGHGGSWGLVDRDRFTPHGRLEPGVEPRAEVDFAAEDAGQFFTVSEEPKADAAGCLRPEVGEHVDVAADRVEVVAERGAEHAQTNDAPVAAEGGNAVAIKPDRQLLDIVDHSAAPRSVGPARRQSGISRHPLVDAVAAFWR
jgi:hypothetical protein